ncbi:hypothetical protein [Streptomyces sp. NPDC012888]|uniref:hypothetical protein n=1 Tax=Streptomyces sp. NPDC012888 TaxID=3364855 RepID=UPI003690E0EB
MAQSGQGGYGYPHEGGPWGPPPGAVPQPPHVVAPGYEDAGAQPAWGQQPPAAPPAYPAPHEAATQYIPPVPAAPHEAATQYIPPVPAAPHEAATQYIPPVPAAPHEAATQYILPVPAAPHEAATQYIPPVPAAPHEAATQYIPPVPAAPHEAATQYIPPVPAAPGDERGHTQELPVVQEPVLRQPPPGPRGHRPPPPPGQYAPHPPPYEEPEPPRRVSAGIIAACVIGLAVAGLGVGALLSEPGKAQNNDPAAVSSVPSPTGSAAVAAEAPVDPARAQAVQLDKLLADSKDSRATVIRAVEDIRVCKNLDQAAEDLRDAARQRDEMVTRLRDTRIDKLPDNARLSASLTKAWQSSAAADRSYAAWAEDVGGKGEDKDDDRKKGCKDGRARGTANAVAGNRASGEATRAKETAAVLWNRIAGTYQLTKRDKSQL